MKYQIFEENKLIFKLIYKSFTTNFASRPTTFENREGREILDQKFSRIENLVLGKNGSRARIFREREFSTTSLVEISPKPPKRYKGYCVID